MYDIICDIIRGMKLNSGIIFAVSKEASIEKIS